MSKETLAKVYFNPRVATMIGLGFASGLPNLLPQDTLKAWLVDANINVVEIGLFGLVTFPYVFKFLWAPFLDAYMPPLLGRRRGWLVIAQLGVALGLLAMAAAGPEVLPGSATQPATTQHVVTMPSLWLLGLASAIVVFFSASQDIVADAYRTDTLAAKERGVGAATFVMGYRIAMIVAGAGVLFAVEKIGWRAAYHFAAALMGLMTIVTFVVDEPPRFSAPPTLRNAVVEPLREFFGDSPRDGLILFLFVFLFKLPDVMSFSMAVPLLKSHLKFTNDEIGAVRQVAGFVVTIAGALVGGGIAARIGMRRSLWLFGALQAVSNFAYWWIAWHDRDFTMFVVAIIIEHFGLGLVTAGLVGFLMSQCDKRYSAFQYAILSAVMAATGLVFQPWCGKIVEWIGYPSFFFTTVLAGIPGLVVLWFLKIRTPPDAAPETESGK